MVAEENKMADIETLGLGLCWEDLPVGRKFKTVGRTITEGDLANFVSCTGMLEVLFTNVEYLKTESAIKGRVVPAALAYSFAEGLVIQASMQGAGLAFLNMELDVKAPTFVGDTIHVECEVIECQESKRRPGVALVRTRNQIIKQDGTVVIVYTPLRMVKGRGYKTAQALLFRRRLRGRN
jgi:acyl dehydratase